ncbi:uncharacterized protein AMSG_01180 [Thecamonas trahens ATCC 50062]|uniref:Uncharacterized protein n=1 Tax=Thecamonas trahens ATCC 50062 TaxID=461836 RepID=A0A0L0DMD0_THETB|nr:hypothetical protein AMSG_01180 [Thecamonas trahens ATCC 50062]KNC53467.1 hypothetical protein AMSG_01180 [Thecamonas trahens ATCC 50062]|eukprot:XP_013761791.1 hypothetical protein AMSG_01180 [Thecamonas trahens ATCC 50062]
MAYDYGYGYGGGQGVAGGSSSSSLLSPRTAARHVLFDQLSNASSLAFSLRDELQRLPHQLDTAGAYVGAAELDGSVSETGSKNRYQALMAALEAAAAPISASSVSSLGTRWEPEIVRVNPVAPADGDAAQRSRKRPAADPLVRAMDELEIRTRGSPWRAPASSALALLSAVPVYSDGEQGRRVWQVLVRAVEAVTTLVGDDSRPRLDALPHPVLTANYRDDDAQRAEVVATEHGVGGAALAYAVQSHLGETPHAPDSGRRGGDVRLLRRRIFDIAALYEARIAELEDELEAVKHDPGPAAVVREVQLLSSMAMVDASEFEAVEARYRTLGELLRAELAAKEKQLALLRGKLALIGESV